jgi:tetratricopeptide (TPR) repeat protein
MKLAVILTALVITALAAQEPEWLELRVKTEPPAANAMVSLYGSLTPFSDRTMAGPDGSFTFRKLKPGSYTVNIFLPGRGEVRRTVSVTPSLADSRGRVQLTLDAEPPPESAEAAHTVRIRDLEVPRRARSLYNDAQKHLRKGDIPAAIGILEKAVEMAPQFVDAWNNLGTIAYQTQRYEDAERFFRRALEAEPGSYSPTVNLGGTLLNLNRPQEALPYNEYCVRRRPNDALAHAQMGLNLSMLEQLDSAVEHLNKARELDPAHFSLPQLQLARIHLFRRDYTAARRELEEFLKYHPDSPSAAAVREQIQLIQQQKRGGKP